MDDFEKRCKEILLIGGDAHMQKRRIVFDCNAYYHPIRTPLKGKVDDEVSPSNPNISEQVYIQLAGRIFVYNKMPREDVGKIIERAFGI